MTFRIFQLNQGTSTTASDTVQLLSAKSTGTKGALRRLVHPDSTLLPPITYYMNPTRIYGYDNDVLRSPITRLIRTLSSSKLLRFDEVTEDVVIIERWEAPDGLGMPAFMFRDLYNLHNNPPGFSATAQTYIQWEPRDRSEEVYNVELVDLVVGGGSPGKFDIRWVISPSSDGHTLATPSDNIEGTTEDMPCLDRPVTLVMRVVGEV